MPFARCNDINVYYEIHGEGTPLFFLNGLSSCIAHKMAFINAAKKYFKLIVPDIRGAGLTDKPQGPYSIAQFASDSYELIKKLALKKINVMGFSMGGCIAARLAVDHPKIIDRLILVSTKPSWSKPCPSSDEADRIFHSTDISEKLLVDLFNIIYGPSYKERVSAKDYVKERIADPNPQPVHGYLGQLHACESFDLCEEIKTIKKETLVITGKDDQLILPQNSQWLHDNISNSRLVKYNGVGHMTVDECPERLVSDIVNFLS